MSVGMEKYIMAMEAQEKIDQDDVFAGDDSDDDNEIDLYAPVDFTDLDEVMARMFAVVERSTTGHDQPWFHYLNDWDRRFVLNLYDRQMTTGSCPVSEKQAIKAAVIVRKMMTPVSGKGRGQ